MSVIVVFLRPLGLRLLASRNDIKYERNDIIALLAKALFDKTVRRNYVRGLVTAERI